jgi:hypothetical protein
VKKTFALLSILLPAFAATAADNAPPLKEGLWSIHMHTVDNPGNKASDNTYSLCRNHAYDDHARALAKEVKGCNTVSEASQGSKYITEVRCTVGTTAIATKGIVTFDGDTAAHSESRATYTPAMYGKTETTMVMDQKYTGACPAGAQPGDRIMEDGKIVHRGKS